MLTETEGMKLSAQSNHIPVELQQTPEDFFFCFLKLDSLICLQPLPCLSLPPFLIFLQSLLCADRALCSVPHVMPTEQHWLKKSITVYVNENPNAASLLTPHQQEEKDSQTGGKSAKFQWLLITSQAGGNTFMPKKLAVFKWGYFFMLKSVLPQISSNRMNDRE